MEDAAADSLWYARCRVRAASPRSRAIQPVRPVSMNLRASRNRILPAVVVLIALGANGTPHRSTIATRPAPEPVVDPVVVSPTVGTPSGVSESGSPGPSIGTSITHDTAPPATPPPTAAGMVIGVDPETGALGPPTDSQWAELRSAAAPARSRRDAAVEIRRPDGAVGIDVGGWLQEFAVVRTGPDGKPIFGCLRPGDSAAPDSAASPLEIQ